MLHCDVPNRCVFIELEEEPFKKVDLFTFVVMIEPSLCVSNLFFRVYLLLELLYQVKFVSARIGNTQVLKSLLLLQIIEGFHPQPVIGMIVSLYPGTIVLTKARIPRLQTVISGFRLRLQTTPSHSGTLRARLNGNKRTIQVCQWRILYQISGNDIYPESHDSAVLGAPVAAGNFPGVLATAVVSGIVSVGVTMIGTGCRIVSAAVLCPISWLLCSSLADVFQLQD